MFYATKIYSTLKNLNIYKVFFNIFTMIEFIEYQKRFNIYHSFT